QAAEELIAGFENLQQIAEDARNDIDDEDFLEKAEPYLNNLDIYGDAVEVAVNYLMTKKNGQSDKADEYQDQLRELMVQANKMPQMIGEQVVKPFLIDSMWGDLNVAEY